MIISIPIDSTEGGVKLAPQGIAIQRQMIGLKHSSNGLNGPIKNFVWATSGSEIYAAKKWGANLTPSPQMNGLQKQMIGLSSTSNGLNGLTKIFHWATSGSEI